VTAIRARGHPSTERPGLGTLPYVVGGLSYIPLIGILFGAIAVVWGLTTRKADGRRLALIGAGGVAVTVVAYSALFYFGFVQRGGVYDDLRIKLAEGTLTTVVHAIEVHKLQTGAYPESLEALRASVPNDTFVFVFDSTDIGLGGTPRYFHYQVVDSDHYYLLGVGPDGQPFTADDVLPKVELKPGSRLGLLIKGSRAGE
jgi:hypothetical protein